MEWLLVFALTLPPQAANPSAPLATGKDRLSYAMGMDLGHQLRARSVDIDPALFGRGLADALSGGGTLLTEAEAKAAISELQKGLAVRQAAAAKAAGEKNKAEGDAFLAANRAKEGIVALPSGLQYKVLAAGSGRKPGLEDTVVCHYRGRLIGGQEFDSSYGRGQPITTPVKGAINGWTEVLQLMPVGSRWEVFVPASLAYGERDPGGDVGANATLIFEIELLAIK